MGYQPLLFNGFIIGQSSGGGGGGTVTSVGLADGSSTPIYTISGSPVTGSGTLTFTLSTKPANVIFAGPSSGGAAQPTFRSLVAADIPSLSGIYANTALSNLSSTAVNASIIPSLNNNIDLGDTALRWRNVYASTLSSGSATLSVTGAGVQFNGLRLQSVADPVSAQDALTLNYFNTHPTSPGGANTNVQFNDSGIFGGTNGLVFDKTNVRLGINQATPKGRIHANSGTTSGTVGADAIILGKPHTTANIGQGATIEGGSGGANTASGQDSHAEGINAIASGDESHAEGSTCQATNAASHAEGGLTVSSGVCSHAEGLSCTASAQAAHAEGDTTTATGDGAHSEGINTIAAAQASHAEGSSTQANQNAAHAEGISTQANAPAAHAGGLGTIAAADNQTTIGQYNISNGSVGVPLSTDSMLIVGIGANSGARDNGFAVKKDGRNISRLQVLDNQTQVLAAAGTISSSFALNQLNPAGNVTSSVTTAISAGLQVGQLLTLTNISAFTVTIKNAAGTELPNALDYVLNPKDVISLIWIGTNWRSLSSSTN